MEDQDRIDNGKRKGKLSSLIVFLCALVIAGLYTLDLKNDYYFYSSRKETNARIESLDEVHEYMPYIINVSYYNEYTAKVENCFLKLDGRFGGEIKNSKMGDIGLIYTRQSPSDIYLKGYKVPTKGAFIIHLLIFSISVLSVIVFGMKLFRKSS